MSQKHEPEFSGKHHKGNKATMDHPQEEFILDEAVPSRSEQKPAPSPPLAEAPKSDAPPEKRPARG